MPDELTPEAKAEIAAAVRIVREDLFEKHARTVLSRHAPADPPPTPPIPPTPPTPSPVPVPPPPKPPDDTPPPVVRRGLWWGDQVDG